MTDLIEITPVLDGSIVPSKVKKNSKLHSDFSNKEGDHLIESENELVSVILDGTNGTDGTANNDGGCSGSMSKNGDGTDGTMSNDAAYSDSSPFDLAKTIKPMHETDDSVMEKVRFDDLKKALNMATPLLKKTEKQETQGAHQKTLLMIMVNIGLVF